jgi:hypothetical protein
VKPSSDVTGLYRSFPAYLWVEDEETRTYLETAWNGESRIKIYVAGGHTHLSAVVSAARNDWNTHVFGFRDRDFGTSNRARWKDDTVTVLAGDAVELENLLLDADAIAGCAVNTSGLNAAQIEREMLQLAQPLTWWMSCRRTITELRDAVMDEFLAHPTRGHVTSQQDAENAIFTSPWWATVLPSLHPKWGIPATVSTQLVQHEATFRGMLASDAWRREFSGTRRRPADPEGRLEFVRAIAETQRDQGHLPPEVADLRTAILFRIGH